MTRGVRLAFAAVVMLAVVGCTREVPLRLGPAALVMPGNSRLEVRVWNAGACPADARAAADLATLDDVAVVRYFDGARDATAVGAVPAGAHAVTVIVRDASCNVVLYGCTPNVDFATAPAVNVIWAVVAPGLACEPGFACESGACYEPRGADAAGRDAGR